MTAVDSVLPAVYEELQDAEQVLDGYVSLALGVSTEEVAVAETPEWNERVLETGGTERR